MMAAIIAAEQGAVVQVLERLPRVGKKLLATGNGRCNLSNQDMTADHYHGDTEFIQSVLSQFGFKETLQQFEQLGLSWIAEPETRRIYPRSLQASSVLDILRTAMKHRDIKETCDAPVKQIQKTDNSFQVLLGSGETIRAGRVILTAGGRASPNLGSNGSGYKLAEQLGHTIRPTKPAVVQLTWKQDFSKRLKGLKVQAAIALKNDEQILRTETGEIHFTDNGLSGIPALQMARLVHEFLDKGQTPVLHINLLPGLTHEDVRKELVNRIHRFPRQSIQESMISLLHKRLIPVLLNKAGIEPGSVCSKMTEMDIKSLIITYTDLQIPVTGTRSWSSAQVTSGGVITDEVNSNTLESKLVPGLYFAGEILDVDGDCGGYNLQWAWSSGWIAGKSAAIIS